MPHTNNKEVEKIMLGLSTSNKCHLIDGKFYYLESDVKDTHHQELQKALQAERQRCEEMVEIFEDKLKAVYEANRKHIEDFEKDSTAYKYNPSEENLAKMKIHEGGNAGFRGGMIEGKMEAYEFIIKQLTNKDL